MARIEVVEEKRAPLVSRLLAKVARRKWGRVTEMMRITASMPKVAMGWAVFEMLFDRSTFADRKVRKLAAVKTAMQLGCAP